MKGFYSPIEKLAEESTRPRGTGAEFMAELGKRPGFKQAEVEDRNLQALQSMPKMAREDFIANLKAQRPTMPKERVFRNDPKDLTYEEDYDKQYHGITGEPYHEEHTLPGGTNYREILLQHPHGSFPGVREHFGGAPNVLASMRVKDRTSPEGKKILHIEEIQSDWHKKGSKKGYAPIGEDLHDTAKQAEVAHRRLKEKLAQAKSNSQNAEGVLASDRPLYQDPEVRARYTEALKGHNRDIMDLMPQVMKAEEAHRKAKELASNAVPDAPFKKNWHELALKRMIQHAVEQGHHEIHITPGETQARRWGAEGEGAKGFHDLYDKQIPQFLNKFGKQFGVQTRQAPFVHTQDPKTAAEDDELLAQLGIETPRNVKPQMLHRFDITPEMREHVLKNGMPLYAKGGSTGVSRETIKPVAHGIIKERVTVAPNMDAMQYELMSAKRFTKKVK